MDTDLQDDNGGRWWVLPLRISVSLGLLVLLAIEFGHKVSLDDLLPDFDARSMSWLAAATALMLVSYVLSTLRWQQVVVAMDLRTPFSRLLSAFLAGQFISNALPTTIGGDVLRVARLSKDTDDTPASFASVVLERLTGWVVLPIITVLGLVVNPELQGLGRQTAVAAAIAVVTLTLLVVILAAVDHPKIGGRFTANDGWKRFAGALHLGFVRLRGHRRAAFSVLGVAFAYQFALVLSAWAAARALDIHVGITAIMAFFPAVLIAQVLPISIGGFGVREYMLVFLLGAVDVRDEQALALGLLVWVITAITSLIGAPSYLLGGGRSSVGFDDQFETDDETEGESSSEQRHL